MQATERFASAVLAAAVSSGGLAAAQSADQRQLERIEEMLRQEGQAVVALADAAARHESLPGDFPLDWHNDFLKAQAGTFVPFIVSVGRSPQHPPAALLYVRASRRAPDGRDERRSTRRGLPEPGGLVVYPFEEIYPIALNVGDNAPTGVARGFALAPGEYDITVVVRERERENARGRRLLAAALRRPLRVPDFSGSELTTSSIILGNGLTVLKDPPPPEALGERPYVIAGREIHPVADRILARSEELVVVFLVYNPFVTREKHFDLEVEYHFFRRGATGETYFNRTEPQRFNPVSLGPQYDPMAGHPIMAGQGVPLAGFEAGEYRLAIKVTDLISGQSISREVTFSVRP